METTSFNQAGFLKHLAAGRLMAARCSACQALLLPPRSLCPHCFTNELEWVQLSGDGELIGYTLIYVGLPAMAAEGYDRQQPYCSGVVRLAEGPAISALIVSDDGAPPAHPRVGLPVKVVFGRQAGLAFQAR